MTELCQLMFRLKSGIWPILGLELAFLATFFKISTSNLFSPSFKLEVNRTRNYNLSLQKATQMAISQFGFFQSVRH